MSISKGQGASWVEVRGAGNCVACGVSIQDLLDLVLDRKIEKEPTTKQVAKQKKQRKSMV